MTTVSVVGLGYVGLPLAAEFGRQFETIGFDISARRVQELRAGRDATGEVTGDHLAAANRLRFSCDSQDLAEADVHVDLARGTGSFPWTRSPRC
jgi:UDP-N-acetyl-D-galactosamine dehydrogenase